MTNPYTHPLHLSDRLPADPARSWQRPREPAAWIHEKGPLICPTCHTPFAYDGPRNPCHFRCLACGEWLTWRATGERTERVELGDPICLKCGAPMVLKNGRYGEFYGCTMWPKTKCKGKEGPRGRVVVVEFSVELAVWEESEPWEVDTGRERWRARDARVDAIRRKW